MSNRLQATIVLIAVFCLLGTANVSAQADNESDNSETGITVVSYFKCYDASLSKAVEMYKDVNAPHINKLVDDGKLMSWGILTHYWGDEWNLISYFIAKDLATFEKAYSEAVEATMEENPDAMDKWRSMCSEHKDNIYSNAYNYSGS